MQDLLTEKSIFSGVLGLKIQRILASEVYLYAVFSRTIATFLQWAGLYWLLFKASVTPYAWMVVRVADLMANREIVDWALLILRDSSMSWLLSLSYERKQLPTSWFYLSETDFIFIRAVTTIVSWQRNKSCKKPNVGELYLTIFQDINPWGLLPFTDCAMQIASILHIGSHGYCNQTTMRTVCLWQLGLNRGATLSLIVLVRCCLNQPFWVPLPTADKWETEGTSHRVHTMPLGMMGLDMSREVVNTQILVAV